MQKTKRKLPYASLLTIKEKLSRLRIPIKVKLSIAIIFIIWITILILSFIILDRQKDQLYSQAVKTGKISLNYFANNAKIPLLKDSILELNTLIKESASVKEILYAIIVDRKNVIKAHTNLNEIGNTLKALPDAKGVAKQENIIYFNYKLPSGGHVLNLSGPVTFKNKKLGAVHVGISIDFINKQIRSESVFILLLSFLIIMLGIAVAIFLGTSFSRPISKLVLASQEIGKGNYEYKVDIRRNDELGDLATAFNYMSKELWKKLLIEKSFGRYVSPDILNMIMAHPENSWLKGAQNEATILFADVRGFMAYSEIRQPEEVIEALNEYFGIATQYILKYGGYVDKFIGDAVLGVFCVPIYCSDHAERAVRAAVAMQKEWQQRSKKGNRLLSRIGIGIDFGIVVSGNIGSQIKTEYTVIGNSVNVASRLNTLAGPGEIIISKNIYQSIKDMVSVKVLPPQKIKGISEPIEAFQLLDIK